jgi:hypothetical protein
MKRILITTAAVLLPFAAMADNYNYNNRAPMKDNRTQMEREMLESDSSLNNRVSPEQQRVAANRNTVEERMALTQPQFEGQDPVFFRSKKGHTSTNPTVAGLFQTDGKVAYENTQDKDDGWWIF